MTSLIDTFKTDTIGIIRNVSRGKFSDETGMYEGGKKEKITIDAVVRPSLGKDLQRLPESQRTSEIIKIYSKEKLLTSNEALSRTADCVEYRGCTYQVQNVEDHTMTRLNHYKSLAAKVEVDSNDRIVK